MHGPSQLKNKETSSVIREYVQHIPFFFSYIHPLTYIFAPMISISTKIQDKLDKTQLEKAASMLRAIAHPVRISIIGLLDEGNRLPVKTIHETLGLEQAVASHHLGILRNKGVLNSEREGKNIFYSLKYDRLIQVVHCIEKCSEEEH